MATFAKIGLNNKVIEVQSVVNEVLHDADGNEQENIGVDFLTKLTGWSIWKQTSYNGNFRKNHAGIGYTYDEDKDAFIPIKPYNSWVLNEETCKWEAPIALPDTENNYVWNEETQQWDLTDE
jgi:hypothetical protein|tara:strand:+ start:444 stop:809 length:366 start_codon:yes stop_codon:yes gene_type:complete